MKKTFNDESSSIEATEIEIGNNFSIGKNVNIKARKKFKIGHNGRFGDNVTINAEEVIIGDHFFHLTPGLTVGGGGSQFKDATITIGDRCVVHNNYINLACPVTLGNDVGLSPDVDFLTHGFWNSVLEGYPCKYGGIVIGNGVIIGQRSFIMMGANIPDNCVIGANSTVTKPLKIPKGIYAGVPVKYLRSIEEPSEEQKILLANEFMSRYECLKNPEIAYLYKYPKVRINACEIDLLEKTLTGIEDEDSDMFRDFIRRYGIKIYTDRGFKSL